MRQIPANSSGPASQAVHKAEDSLTPGNKTAVPSRPKELRFVGSSLKDMREMPEQMKDGFGYNLWTIQLGDTPANVSPFEGSKGGDIMKLTERHDGGTYRCVYAARFEKAVYVLHVFQKKSKSGIATPQADIDKVHNRFKSAQAEYNAEFPPEEKK